MILVYIAYLLVGIALSVNSLLNPRDGLDDIDSTFIAILMVPLWPIIMFLHLPFVIADSIKNRRVKKK